VDPRKNPPMTTTLWMEGAELNRRGFLKIPADVTVVFADNTPGWRMQADFHETPREPGRTYGIYYHHAVWGWGPHLVQGVAPWKTEEIFRQAVAKKSSHYAILNVSNVREFALGLAASARMLRRMEGFDGRAYLRAWCAERFAPAGAEAGSAYRALFDSYFEDPRTLTPALLDGTTVSQGKRLMRRLLSRLNGEPDQVRNPGAAQPAPENLGRFLPNMPNPSAYPIEELAELAGRQRRAVKAAGAQGDEALRRMLGANREFFENNFIAQQRMFAGLLGWLECAAQANLARDHSTLLEQVRRAAGYLAQVREAQALASRGRWKDWYRGDRKMNLAQAEQFTREAMEAAGRAQNDGKARTGQ
jgi:hypothetical protein